MARQRRGGPPERLSTLGSLLRTTLAQAGGLRDVLERGAREGRARLDDALSSRRRNEVLADLGEVVLDLIRRGEIELEQLPEARELVAQLDEMDGSADDEAQFSRGPRSRFDDRGGDDGTVSAIKKTVAKVWKPPIEESSRPVEVEKPVQKKLGGISFGAPDDDDDLAEYMHPDDVPPKAK